MRKTRVRFAPSPTGALHIGGVRTALYNYLLAKNQGGDFILRIEDTDQVRYVPGAEQFITKSLSWLNLHTVESPIQGGEFAPYRQSERSNIYKKYIEILLERGKAYYAFDTVEELDIMRKDREAKGENSPKYDATYRLNMRNSLTLPAAVVNQLIEDNTPYTIRLKVEPDELISFKDEVRDLVQINTNELDDKVLLKADGLPTYHFANVVDDHLMEISHVIRGEEWLPSTAHHVLLYRAFDWEDTMPKFCHLPLILKPQGNGKLSKRDGAKFGFPVFPISWQDGETDTLIGFRESGFLHEAVINFLALLGWNPGDDREIFSIEELCSEFSLKKINKSGAKFNYEKAKWFNQQYILRKDAKELYTLIEKDIENSKVLKSKSWWLKYIEMMKPRVQLLTEFIIHAPMYHTMPPKYDETTLSKKYKVANEDKYQKMVDYISQLEDFSAKYIETKIKDYLNENQLHLGEALPLLRIAIMGSTQGADLMQSFELMGKEDVLDRLTKSFLKFKSICANN